MSISWVILTTVKATLFLGGGGEGGTGKKTVIGTFTDLKMATMVVVIRVFPFCTLATSFPAAPLSRFVE